MKLILIGCEYVGTTTLATAIGEWAGRAMGERMGFHDHWKIPKTSGHPPHETSVTNLTAEEQEQVLALSPRLKEIVQRYNIFYHLPSSASESDYMAIGVYIEDGIYGALYFGYGGVGKPGDRRAVSRDAELRLLRFAPEAVLVHVTATPDVIAWRMRELPHATGVLKEQDIELVLGRFDEEYRRSLLRNKIELDTSRATVEETLAEFVAKVQPYLTERDRLRML